MNNSSRQASEYLRTKVLTASPEQLHLMLYDGAIRFAEEAKAALAESRLEDAHNAFVRAQAIVLELSSSLNHEVDPDLCGKQSSLYNFIHRRLVEANLNHDTNALADALRVLNYQRETWVMLMQTLDEQNRPADTDEDTDGQADQMPLSISV